MSYSEPQRLSKQSRIMTLFDKQFLPWIICSLGALFYCYEYFLRIAPSVMADDLMQAFHINAGELGHLSAFYYYAYAPMQLFVGILMDRFGARRLLTLACLCCTVGIYLFSFKYNIYWAEFGRFITGFGSAFAFVGALKLATDWLPPQRFATVSGLAVTLGMVGAVVGDVSLAAFVQSQGWRVTNTLSAVAGLILMVVIYTVVRDKPRQHFLSPYKKTMQVTPAISFKEVLRALKQTVKRKQIWLNGVISGLLFLSISAFAEMWGIPYLRAEGLSNSSAAFANSFIFIGFAVGGPIFGWISDYTRCRRLPILAGSILSMTAMSALLFFHSLSLHTIYFLLFTLGATASAQIITFAIGREVSPSQIAGTSIAFTNMVVMAFGALFQPLLGYLLHHVSVGVAINGVPAYSVMDYRHVLKLLPLCFGAATILTLFLRETHCRVTENSQ